MHSSKQVARGRNAETPSNILIAFYETDYDEYGAVGANQKHGSVRKESAASRARWKAKEAIIIKDHQGS